MTKSILSSYGEETNERGEWVRHKNAKALKLRSRAVELQRIILSRSRLSFRHFFSSLFRLLLFLITRNYARNSSLICIWAVHLAIRPHKFDDKAANFWPSWWELCVRLLWRHWRKVHGDAKKECSMQRVWVRSSLHESEGHFLHVAMYGEKTSGAPWKRFQS